MRVKLRNRRWRGAVLQSDILEIHKFVENNCQYVGVQHNVCKHIMVLLLHVFCPVYKFSS